MEQPETCVFVGMPLHNRTVDIEAAHALYMPARPGSGYKIIHWSNVNSSLGHCFNGLLCAAYGQQECHKITHFAMIHGDVHPEPFWLNPLMDELDRTGADLVSAVIAIKDDQGLSSTGLYYPHKPHLPIRRLTFTEVHKSRLPRTFCHKDLIDCGLATGEQGEVMVLNTGLWVARYDRPWFQENKIVFRQTHEIKKIARPDGKGHYLQAWFMPEDWIFSAELADWGAKVYATTAVNIDHIGSYPFNNSTPWGKVPYDEQFRRMTEMAQAG